jgi:hypothetical protein
MCVKRSSSREPWCWKWEEEDAWKLLWKKLLDDAATLFSSWSCHDVVRLNGAPPPNVLCVPRPPAHTPLLTRTSDIAEEKQCKLAEFQYISAKLDYWDSNITACICSGSLLAIIKKLSKYITSTKQKGLTTSIWNYHTETLVSISFCTAFFNWQNAASVNYPA